MKTFIVLACVGLLGGCSAPMAGVVGAAALPVVAQAAKAAPVLSDIALAGCAAQAAANVAGAVATQNGNATWATRFAEVSQVAGFACSW